MQKAAQAIYSGHDNSLELARIKSKTNSNSIKLTIWNRTHLNVFNYTGEFLDSLFTIKYSGYHPLSIAEYLISNDGNFFSTELDNLFEASQVKNSLSIYDFYEPKYFPVRTVVPKIELETLVTLTTKLKVKQLIVLDLDTEEESVVHLYNPLKGLQTSESNYKSDVNAENSNNKGNKYVNPAVQDFLTNRLKSFLVESLAGLDQVETGWVFTGECVTAYNKRFGEFVKEIFSSLDIDLPVINFIAIDKFQLINYLHIFPKNFLQSNYRSLFKRVPLTIINTLHTGNPHNPYFSLADKTTRNYTLIEKKFNLHLLEEGGLLANNRGWLTPAGVIWFWTKASNKNYLMKLSKLPADKQYADPEYIHFQKFFKFTQIKKVLQLNNFLNLKKKSTWRIKLSKSQINELQLNTKLDLPRRMQQQKLRKLNYQYVGNVEKKDLLVMNGQKVEHGELVIKERKINYLLEAKPVFAPTSGIISTKNLEEGFLQYDSGKNVVKDLSWIRNYHPVVIGKNTNGFVEVLIDVQAIPMLFSIGTSHVGNLVVANDMASAKKLVSFIPNSILVYLRSLSNTELASLYSIGYKVVIAAGLKEGLNLPESYWKIFGLGIISESGITISAHFRKLILLNQFVEVYFDSYLNELKLPANLSIGSKFDLDLGRKLNESLNLKYKKGMRVLTLLQGLLFAELKIIHIQGEDIWCASESGEVLVFNEEELIILG